MQTNVNQGQISNTSNIQPQPVMYQPQVVTTPVQSQPGQQYAGVNIQIFNPAVGMPGVANVYGGEGAAGCCPHCGCYPSNYYIENFGNKQGQTPTQPVPAQSGAETADEQNVSNEHQVNSSSSVNKSENENSGQDSTKKTEKRQIVQLTDDYIKTLENYLNSQDYEVRLMGAKEVVARAQEDESRKDDKALTALTNKMLQDPAVQIRILAQSLLESRAITGDDYTVGVLKNMQNSKEAYGQDALAATNILLKMAGKTTEKEFEVKDKPKNTDNGKK